MYSKMYIYSSDVFPFYHPEKNQGFRNCLTHSHSYTLNTLSLNYILQALNVIDDGEV